VKGELQLVAGHDAHAANVAPRVFCDTPMTGSHVVSMRSHRKKRTGADASRHARHAIPERAASNTCAYVIASTSRGRCSAADEMASSHFGDGGMTARTWRLK
jgi:hypothetical protein